MPDQPTSGHLVSAIPGRMRVRLDRHAHAQPHAARIRDHIAAGRDIRRVDIHQGGHSVVVHYDPQARSQADVLDMLRDAGLIVRDVATVAGVDLPDAGNSTTSESVIQAMDDLDDRLSRATGRRLDLKLVFPLGLGIVGVVNWMQNGLGLTSAPAYIVLWYAFDSFFKLHEQRRPHSSPIRPARPSRERVDDEPRHPPSRAQIG